jgi:hypothetical protein
VTLGRSPAHRRGSGGGKPARRTPGRWGRMCGAQAWTDETNGARGERNFWPAGGGSVLMGSGGEGAGGVDVAWRQSGGERGAWRGVEQRGGVASARQWRAAGSAQRGRRGR